MTGGAVTGRAVGGRAATCERSDDGSVLVLVLGLFAVLLLLVAVVVDVSSVVLARRSLSSAADGAAVSGAQALDYGVFYAEGPGAGVPLSPQGVSERVQAYAVGAEADQPGLAMDSRVDDGHVAVVVATRSVRVPFGGWLDVGRVELTARAAARAPLVAP